MATMKDIAKLAGVSTSTVSHVINKTRFVSEEISERVNNAAKELNYYAPSALARSLKVNRTKTIGMLVTTSTNPFFGEVVKGVERSCYHKGYSLILCNTEGDNERMRQSINTLLQKRVDGLILMCSSLEGERIDVFERYPDIPVVVMDWGPMLFTSDKIQDNSLRGGYLAAKYLIDCGHTEIGCITGPLIKHQAQMRYEGYKRAMNEAGLEFNANWIIESDFECEGGYQAFKKMAERGKLPSSIFVSNDMMAMGVINAANELGIKVPDDLSIIGYDDIHIAKFMSPSLTTIHQPKYRLGQAAVETLVRRLDDKSNEAQVVQLEPTLVVRNSVKLLNC
ncbi:TPA: substrate-binding domain-containing protein [Vibrio parahaemolyticus]|uniref:substrate-binding domain-containing protein n=1 Tax=Vibrio parahaemolyticus TaxID=670 RepID=UPI00064AEE54|nr:substrate-binding domain-containing protein [Vibrio parahaemolyticus]EGQ9315318.1 LacI family DNA-binding transcriptional regulator [Vibrio parahaemolyticus]EGR1575318.1 LacI family DNA-binding transcriptional regulator [Vibrio parahaemolyticus]EGS6497489.1 substrate-binding domain-containing protein [Vibrio parahaemolyticus]EHH1170049.1 substrate-binding domain-containing protein [Vibrio parahaemolyticus]EHH2500692.1 substrate-binding domain-containing protein [Vibrio parahaemolyticus]